MKILCIKLYCIPTNKWNGRYTVLHTCHRQQMKLDCLTNVMQCNYTNHKVWWCASHAPAIQLVAQNRTYTGKNFKQYLIILSPEWSTSESLYSLHLYTYIMLYYTYTIYIYIYMRSVRKVMRMEFLRSLRPREGKGKSRSLTGGVPDIG
jgi:hypothetical protein